MHICASQPADRVFACCTCVFLDRAPAQECMVCVCGGGGGVVRGGGGDVHVIV